MKWQAKEKWRNELTDESSDNGRNWWEMRDSWCYRWERSDKVNLGWLYVQRSFAASVVLAVEWHCVGGRRVSIGIVILVDCLWHGVAHWCFVHWCCHLHNGGVHFISWSIGLRREGASVSQREPVSALLTTYRGRVSGRFVRAMTSLMTSLVTSIVGLREI